jgi:hypothetical protein
VIPQLRLVKSSAEIARIRHIAQIVPANSEALKHSRAESQSAMRLGLQLDILLHGADRCPYMTARVHPSNLTHIN